MSDWNIPEKWEQLFSEEPQTYHIYDYDYSCNNIESMALFLESLEVPQDALVVDDGTRVILKHDNYPYSVCIDSYGHGDFDRHGYDITRVDPITYEDFKKKESDNAE